MLSFPFDIFWKLNDGTSDNTADSTGNVHDGVITTATWSDDEYGPYLSFSGSDKVLASRTSSYLGIGGTAGFGFVAGFNTTQTTAGNANAIGGWGTAATGQSAEFQIANGIFWGRFYNNTVTGGSGYNDGAWHLLVVNKPTGGAMADVTAYIDGSELSLTPSGSTTINIVQYSYFTIGQSYNASDHPYTGGLKFVGLRRKVFTQPEVAAMYNGGNWLDFPFYAGKTATLVERPPLATFNSLLDFPPILPAAPAPATIMPAVDPSVVKVENSFVSY